MVFVVNATGVEKDLGLEPLYTYFGRWDQAYAQTR